jgi:hypothetical protein
MERDVQPFGVFGCCVEKKREMKPKIFLTRKVWGEERINKARKRKIIGRSMDRRDDIHIKLRPI